MLAQPAAANLGGRCDAQLAIGALLRRRLRLFSVLWAIYLILYLELSWYSLLWLADWWNFHYGDPLWLGCFRSMLTPPICGRFPPDHRVTGFRIRSFRSQAAGPLGEVNPWLRRSGTKGCWFPAAHPAYRRPWDPFSIVMLVYQRVDPNSKPPPSWRFIVGYTKTFGMLNQLWVDVRC